MTGARSCPRESDVFDAVAAGRWPGCAERELVTHVERCVVCRTLVTAAGAVIALAGDSTGAVVPDAGVVWRHAQRRAWSDAARRATEPLHLAVGLTAACAMGFALAWATPAVRWIAAWGSWISGVAAPWRSALPDLAVVAGVIDRLDLRGATADLGPTAWLFGATSIATLLLVPLTVYLAKIADR